MIVTSNHYVYTNKNGEFDYMYANDLRIGDLLGYSDGELHKITEIYVEQLTDTVYNFETEDNHNYYVGDKQILVHNASDREPWW